jgi:hypothetical protein
MKKGTRKQRTRQEDWEGGQKCWIEGEGEEGRRGGYATCLARVHIGRSEGSLLVVLGDISAGFRKMFTFPISSPAE